LYINIFRFWCSGSSLDSEVYAGAESALPMLNNWNFDLDFQGMHPRNVLFSEHLALSNSSNIWYWWLHYTSHFIFKYFFLEHAVRKAYRDEDRREAWKGVRLNAKRVLILNYSNSSLHSSGISFYLPINFQPLLKVFIFVVLEFINITNIICLFVSKPNGVFTSVRV
jgi:hypothetical protein